MVSLGSFLAPKRLKRVTFNKIEYGLNDPFESKF